MTQNELAFWRDAVIAALHAPGDALERAESALQMYRAYKAEAEDYNRAGAVTVSQPTRLPRLPDGSIKNCALANDDTEVNCQMCKGVCPDRSNPNSKFFNCGDGNA